MKILLSIFSINVIFSTSIINTNLVFKTNNLFINLKTKLKLKNTSLSFLYQDQPNNKITKKFFKNSKFPYLANDPETSYFNDVLLKSIAYDKTSLKLTSSINNLNNYDLKHHESKIDTYLDVQDYSKMIAIKNKNQQNSIIDYNLAFLNHFFNNNALNFNPNGFIISRSKLLSANAKNLKVNNQSVITLNTNTRQNSLNSFLKNFKDSKNDGFSLNVSWSGINFESGSKLLTQNILHNLNASAAMTNLLTLGFQNGKASLNSKNKLNEEPWDAWSFGKMINYLFSNRSAMQSEFEYPDVQYLFTKQFGDQEFIQFEEKLNEAFADLMKVNPYENSTYATIVKQAMIRFGKEKLGYDPEKDLLGNDRTWFGGNTSKKAQKNLDTFDENADETSVDTTIDANDDVAMMLETEGADSLASQIAQDASEAGAAAVGVPIIGWIIQIIILTLSIAIPIFISIELKKVNNWKINIGNLSPKGAWSLGKLRFDKKTRLFRQIKSSQIQFQGQFFKPWFGKVNQKVVDFKPLHAISPNKKTIPNLCADLQNQYNLLSGSNNNFNLIVNPTTWKQMVAAANMPNPQFSVKQILAKNNVNSNNLYLSNQNWVDLIKQIKNPALNQNYAGDFKFQNSKLSYSNLTKNHQSNFKYQSNFNLKEMIVGNSNSEDFLVNHKQLKFLLTGLNYVKTRWNDSKAISKEGKPLLSGIKNSIKYNPKNYKDFTTWYYYSELKPYIWVDTNTSDQENINFIKRIFDKVQSKKFKLSFKKELNLVNNNSILDLSSTQF